MASNSPLPVLQESDFPSLDSISTSQAQSSNLIPPLPASHPISRKIAEILTFQASPAPTRLALQEIANLYPCDQQTKDGKIRRNDEGIDSDDDEQESDQDEDEVQTIDRHKRVDTGKARRNLERDTDLSLEQATTDFLDVLKQLDQSVQLLSNSVSSISQSCSSIQTKLSKANSSTKPLLEQAQGLTQKSNQLSIQRSISRLFLKSFTLSDSELEILESKSVQPSLQLFQIMDKLEKIRKNAQVLLTGEVNYENINLNLGGGMRLGQDVISQTSSQLNQIYEKLAKFLTSEFRKPWKEGQEVGFLIKQSVKRLSRRSDFIRPVLTVLSENRSEALSRDFLNALTVGGPPPTYLPKPIELYAYDPVRYVGDILAWIHQTLATERGWLNGVFSNDDEEEEEEDEGDDERAKEKGKSKSEAEEETKGNQSKDQSSLSSSSSSGKKFKHKRRIGERYRGLEGSLDLTNSNIPSTSSTTTTGSGNQDHQDLNPSIQSHSQSLPLAEVLIRELLDRNLMKCCQILQFRINQTLQSQEGCLTSFKLTGLIDFYTVTMQRTVGSKNRLTKTLKEVLSQSYEAFFKTLERQAKGLGRYQEPLPQDLSPPPPLIGSSTILKELLSLHQSTLIDDEHLSISKSDLNPSSIISSPSNPSDSTRARETPPETSFSFESVLERLMDPMLGMCDRIAKEQNEAEGKKLARLRSKKDEETHRTLSRKSKWESIVFLINCETYVKSIISNYNFISSRTEKLVQTIIERVEELIQLHYEHLLMESGLYPIVEALDTKDPDSPLSHSETCSTEKISLSFNQLNVFLTSSNLITSPRLANLSSPTLRTLIHEMSLEKISQSYARIVEEIQKPSNKFLWKETLINRSVEEVELLLGVQGGNNHGKESDLKERIRNAL